MVKILESNENNSANEVKPVRFHEGLPTVEEAEQNHEQVISDHLFIVGTRKIAHDQLIYVSVGSANVMNLNYRASGFSNPNTNTALKDYIENDSIRNPIIIKSISNIIETEKLDIFVLQETWEQLTSDLESNLPKGWNLVSSVEYIEGQAINRGLAILWNTETIDIPNPYQYLDNANSNDPYINRTLRVECQTKTLNPIFFTLYNVYWPHSDLPYIAAAKIDAMTLPSSLSKEKSVKPFIIAGDFNNRIVPLHRQYLPNNLVPALFNYDKQGTDWTDGIFYFNGKDLEISAVKVFDPFSGKEVLDQAPNLENMPEHQQYNLIRPRPYLNPGLTNQSKEQNEIKNLMPPKLVQYFKNNGFNLFAKCFNAYRSEFISIVALVEPNNSAKASKVIDLIRKTRVPKTIVTINDIKLPKKELIKALSIIFNEAIPKDATPISSIEALKKVLRVEAYIQIYSALRAGQRNIGPKTNFLKDKTLKVYLDGNEYEKAFDYIAEHAKKADSRTEHAWKLAETHYHDCSKANLELFKDIYLWSFQHSTALSRSQLIGATFWSATSLEDELNKIDDADLETKLEKPTTTAGKIIAELKM